MIGREKEKNVLEDCLNSNRPEFLALYGRIRVGKTYLIKEFFDNTFSFYSTGVYKCNTKQQLRVFKEALTKYGDATETIPKDWFEAFSRLERLLEQDTVKREYRSGKRIVFLDELPWMDTARSNFKSALDYFWSFMVPGNPFWGYLVKFFAQESNYTLFGLLFHFAIFPKKGVDIKICISKMYSLQNYSFLYNVITSPLWKYKGLTSEVNPCSFRALISVRIKNPCVTTAQLIFLSSIFFTNILALRLVLSIVSGCLLLPVIHWILTTIYQNHSGIFIDVLIPAHIGTSFINDVRVNFLSPNTFLAV